MLTPVPPTPDLLTPASVRAARGLAGLTVAALAEVSGVGARTIIRLEAGEAVPARATAARMLHALDRLGVSLIGATTEHGPGAYLREPGADAVIVRRDALRGGTEIGVVYRAGGRPGTARVAVSALVTGSDVDAALFEFDARRPAILRAITRKLASEDFDADGHLRVRTQDLGA